ncbi:MAG: DUF4239 domain-containing protein [Candidatus Obscuribacterales bacterium]|nr:DUF4239 domain-containing protein [Candidatus Obscuribacterales bacterium]
MTTLFECIGIVLVSTVMALCGLFIVRKRISRAALEACHEVGGYLLAVVGTLYAILLGLIVVNAQSNVDQARQLAIAEANTLSNIYHLSRPFAQPSKQAIRDSLYGYALAIENQDWSKVEEGKEKEATVPEYRRLWREVTSYVPQGQNEQQCYSTMLADMEQLSDARRHRMVAARCGLSPVLWMVLIVGGAMIVLFTYFFFVESLLAQTLMTSFVVIFLALNIYLIYLYQNPYRKELGVKQAGFSYSFSPNWFKDDPKHPDKD